MKRMLLVFIALLSLSFSAFAAVNLNTATQAELETLEGVGPVKAQAILDYRKKNGGFKSIDDLNKVPGFGDKTVASLKGKVAVSGSAAATAAAPTDSMAKARAAKAEKAAAEKAAASKAAADKKK
ncbi:MAG: ComEA family DNA-binding protein [Candidatus Methylopumilus sp.]|jgi:competence protein ComEA